MSFASNVEFEAHETFPNRLLHDGPGGLRLCTSRLTRPLLEPHQGISVRQTGPEVMFDLVDPPFNLAQRLPRDEGIGLASETGQRPKQDQKGDEKPDCIAPTGRQRLRYRQV